MKTVALYDQYARRAFALLACVCALSAFLYGIFLLEAVGHTASRAHAAQDIRNLKTQLSALESRYLSATQELTPSYAAALGFVAPQSVSTVYATDESRVLTLRTGLPSAQ
jgi:hypothetical protein